ncbi:MAG: PPC domain-containing DNA-binding protein [Patescibacteria group bacterium]
MKHKILTHRDSYLIRINRGEEVIEELTNFCKTQNIASGALTGIGAADEIELGHYSVETKEYSKKTFHGEHEVTSLIGIITDNKVHIHATIADNQFNTFAGHLARMKISGACEIWLTAGEEAVSRVKDDETRLELLGI